MLPSWKSNDLGANSHHPRQALPGPARNRSRKARTRSLRRPRPLQESTGARRLVQLRAHGATVFPALHLELLNGVWPTRAAFSRYFARGGYPKGASRYELEKNEEFGQKRVGLCGLVGVKGVKKYTSFGAISLPEKNQTDSVHRLSRDDRAGWFFVLALSPRAGQILLRHTSCQIQRFDSSPVHSVRKSHLYNKISLEPIVYCDGGVWRGSPRLHSLYAFAATNAGTTGPIV